jgi:hypothetical protein
MVLVVGRDGSELLADDHDRSTANAPSGLTYGTDSADADPLRDRIRALGVRAVARSCTLTFEAVRKFTNGGGTNPNTLNTLLATVTHLEATASRDICEAPGCEQRARGRSKWCSERHRKRGERVAKSADQTPTPEVDPFADRPACPVCRTRFVNPIAHDRHRCQGPRP